MAKYAVGVDFGTLAVRALVAEVETGRELAHAAMDYPHGVMTQALPDGTPLPSDWALQHPQDYLDCLKYVVKNAVCRAQIDAGDVIGLGIDFTASTTLPVDEHHRPLCFKTEFASNPYAWVMLWKHHAAQGYANRMTQIAVQRGEDFVISCGGRISSEMMLPRLWQMAEEAPEIYQAAYRFMEAGDWITWLLTGSAAASANMAAYKLFWDEKKGYPSREFLRAVDPKLEDVTEKLADVLLPLGSRAGTLNSFGAEMTGLAPGTAVSVSCIDAHTALPAAGVVSSGKMMLILGTSGAHLVLNEEQREVPGLLCMVKNGMIPGFFAYEAGQSCCGDHFKWFVENCAPPIENGRSDSSSLHESLTQKAGTLRAGESGLIALDWWNGNRSVLMDADLTGMILGLTLQTRPEEIYRALIEATAYGTRTIVENFEKHGVPVEEVRVCGGIARKNPLLMQIYADVLKRRLLVVRSQQANALGAAILGAVAAGSRCGGYDEIETAAMKMGGTEEMVYEPDPRNGEVYDRLYHEYLELHDWFGKGGNAVMHRLKEISRMQTP